LRNRLLHFRLCNLFAIKTDPAALPSDIEPRLKQTAMSLLSLIDDPALRSEAQIALLRQNANILSERSQSIEAGVLLAVQEAFADAVDAIVSIREVAGRFNALFSFDYGRSFSNKFIGGILRQKLHIETRKTHGVYVIAPSERPKIDALCARFGIGLDAIHIAENPTA
jgi:hypothetical protein